LAIAGTIYYLKWDTFRFMAGRLARAVKDAALPIQAHCRRRPSTQVRTTNPMREPIYIFHPDDYPRETLWEIVRDYVRFRAAGSIGDCKMRELAQKERSSIGSSFTALDMEGIAKRAAFAILEREFPHEFDPSPRESD
jgi:hypothetical protein